MSSSIQVRTFHLQGNIVIYMDAGDVVSVLRSISYCTYVLLPNIWTKVRFWSLMVWIWSLWLWLRSMCVRCSLFLRQWTTATILFFYYLAWLKVEVPDHCCECSSCCSNICTSLYSELSASRKRTFLYHWNGLFQGQNGRCQDPIDIPLDKCGHYDRFHLRLTGAQVGHRVKYIE